MVKRPWWNRLLLLIFSMGPLLGCSLGIYGIAHAGHENPDRWQTDIRQLVNIQEQAVQNGDIEKYMETIVQTDPLYRQEQRRWAADAIEYVKGKTYQRTVLKFLHSSRDEVVALVEQRVSGGRDGFRVQVPIRFRHTPEGWKDADLPFIERKTSRIQIKVTHRQLLPLASELLEKSEVVQQRLAALYGWQPAFPVTLKLYGHPEWFRQSVKLSLPNWVGGWYEAGEAIKLWADAGDLQHPEAIRYYHSAIIHEMVHHMLADLTNDNAAYWLHEGLAEQLTALLDARPENDALPWFDLAELWSWTELAAVSLEQLPADLAEKYYRQARLVTAFLLDSYGDEALRAAFALLRHYPRMPESAADKQEVLHHRTVQALEQALQKPFDALNEEWQRWVEITMGK